MVSPGFFFLAFGLYESYVLIKVRILLFPGHAIFFDQKFRWGGFCNLSHLLKIMDILLPLKCKKSIFFVFCFAWGIWFLLCIKVFFHILILFMLWCFHSTFLFRFINTRSNMAFLFTFFFKDILYYNITVWAKFKLVLSGLPLYCLENCGSICDSTFPQEWLRWWVSIKSWFLESLNPWMCNSSWCLFNIYMSYVCHSCISITALLNNPWQA
jgi:hypothetical protein